MLIVAQKGSAKRDLPCVWAGERAEESGFWPVGRDIQCLRELSVCGGAGFAWRGVCGAEACGGGGSFDRQAVLARAPFSAVAGLDQHGTQGGRGARSGQRKAKVSLLPRVRLLTRPSPVCGLDGCSWVSFLRNSNALGGSSRRWRLIPADEARRSFRNLQCTSFRKTYRLVTRQRADTQKTLQGPRKRHASFDPFGHQLGPGPRVRCRVGGTFARGLEPCAHRSLPRLKY